MDSSSENSPTPQPQYNAFDGNTAPPVPGQPGSPSLQRAAQVHYVDPNGSSAPFAPPPPTGDGDDAPTLRARPSPRWPGQACRYCGWRPVEPGSTCPQCHQPVPAMPERAVPWRPIAIGTSILTGVLVVALLFTVLHHPQTTSLPAQAQRTVLASATASGTPTGSGTSTPALGATNTPTGTGTGVGGGGGAGTPVVAGATPTPARGTPSPTNTPLPTSTPKPGCAWQSRTSSGTYYIFWPPDNYSYGYNISATIHYDGCGNAYASANVTSNDNGSPASIVTAVLYRTANCNGSDKVLSQQHGVPLTAGAHSVGTLSATSFGQHCVFAGTKVGLGAAGDGNSQIVTSVIVTAQ